MSDRIQEQNQRIMVLSQRTLGKNFQLFTRPVFQSADCSPEECGSKNKDGISGWAVSSDISKEPPQVVLPVSKEVVSRLLAMPRPSFSRELVKMEKDGLIKVDGRKIQLLNLADLEKGLKIDSLIGQRSSDL